MRGTKIIKICSSSLCTCLHHMVILRTRNKITDFLMILAWASPFNRRWLINFQYVWLYICETNPSELDAKECNFIITGILVISFNKAKSTIITQHCDSRGDCCEINMSIFESIYSQCLKSRFYGFLWNIRNKTNQQISPEKHKNTILQFDKNMVLVNWIMKWDGRFLI